jgi:dolichol-phosphate mannosyltransferase
MTDLDSRRLHDLARNGRDSHAALDLPSPRQPQEEDRRLGLPEAPSTTAPGRVVRSTRTPVSVLFDERSPSTASYRERRVCPRGTGYLPYRYDVGGLVTIGSEVTLHELEFFRAPRLGKDLDIEIRVGKVGRASWRSRARLLRFDNPAGVRYEEHLGRLAANFAIDLGDRIHVTLSALLARSPHVAYTNVIEALLRFVIARRGHMLLHSACLDLDGRGVLLSARTDTGKTGTVLRLLRERGARFLSDDMTIVSPNGTAQCFPKPLTISSHTLRAVDPDDMKRSEWTRLAVQSRIHSKAGRGVGLAMGNANLPIMTANALTQIVVPPPKYRADRLVDCELTDQIEISDVFIIERGSSSLVDVASAQALDELVENTDDAYGFPPFRYLAPVIVVGGQRYDALQEREHEVLRSVLRRVRVRRMGSESFDWADRIPSVLDEEAPPI